MATPKDDSYRTKFAFFLVLILAIVAEIKGVSLADNRTAAEALTDTYRFSDVIAPSEAESAIAGLKRALDVCEDNYLVYRIKYRIGLIHFRAGNTESSKVEFRQIANDPKCSEPIRAYSLNMIGQISRLRGENEQALDAFDKLVNVLKHCISSDKKRTSNSAMTKLRCSAVLSRAEIYELLQNYTAGIAEYNRLLGLLSKTENRNISSRYAPLVKDRMSQLYLRQGKTDKYMQLSKELTVSYPEYHRSPIIRLESACVEFLNNNSANTEFPGGSFSAPTRLITLVKNSDVTISTQDIVSKLNGLCSKYQDTKGGILLLYHYAWLLDALGEKDKAAKVFARVSSNDSANASNEPHEKATVKSIQEYATIQYAIMAGEKTDYKEALRVLGGLQALPDKSHISELAESVTKGIQTLRREVPKNDNEGK